MLLYIVRHGDPIYKPDSLTPKGEEQAAALVDRMTRFGLDEIYVSPSNRALQTAEPTCQKLGMTPTVLEWCKEHYAYSDFSVRGKDGHTHWVFQDNDYCRLMVSPEMSREEAEKTLPQLSEVKALVGDKQIVKVVFVPGRLLNIVVK